MIDTKEYISSGILEQYALGLLSEEENLQVSRYAEQYPEIKSEIEKIENSLMLLAESNSASAAKLKEGVLAAAAKKSKALIKNDNILNKKQSNFIRYALAASFLLFLLSGVINLLLWKNLNESREIISELSSRNNHIAQQMEDLKQTMDVVKSPAFMKVKLEGMEKSPSSMAMVYWNNKSMDVYIDPMKLPEPPKDMQYQLWAIKEDKPVDAGVLPIGDSSMIRMKNISNADAFAVTLEPMGGKQSPTVEQMYVMGKVLASN